MRGVTGEQETGGAYGLALPGIDPSAGRFLGPAPAGWPSWAIERDEFVPAGWELETMWADRARLRLSGGGWAEIDGRRRVATCHVHAEASPHALIHPYLGLIGAMAALWRGWDYFHAGGVVVDGGVWGVLGERGAGKTSTLAFMAQRAGVEVFCDDILVLDRRGTAFAGPRCADLRADAARHLGVGEQIGIVGARERWRAPLGSVEPELPFRGWVGLAWADRVELGQLSPGQRFAALAANLALRLVPPEPSGLLALAGAPFHTFARPRSFDSLDAGLDRLVSALRGE